MKNNVLKHNVHFMFSDRVACGQFLLQSASIPDKLHRDVPAAVYGANHSGDVNQLLLEVEILDRPVLHDDLSKDIA